MERLSSLVVLFALFPASLFPLTLCAANPPLPRCKLISSVIPGDASPQNQYAFKDLGPLTGNYGPAKVRAMNDVGVLAGYYIDGHNFIWKPPYNRKSLVNVTIPSKGSQVLGLNNQNDLCGSDNHGGFTFIGGVYKSFRHPNDKLLPYSTTSLVSINDKRQAAGTYTCGLYNGSPFITCSFILNVATQTFSSLGPNNGAGYSVSAINNRGITCGTVACSNANYSTVSFVHRAGSFQYFVMNPFSALVGTYASGVGNNGAVVGQTIGTYSPMDPSGSVVGYVLKSFLNISDAVIFP